MSLWSKVKSWFEKDGVHYIAHAIPTARVDVGYDDTPVAADRGYLRVWLVDMFLASSRTWFQDWQPAVHGRVKLTFADQSVELTRLAAPSADKFRAGKSVLANYVLLDLVPFRGGTVEIEAGLLALKGVDRLGAAIRVVAGFADLVVPPLGKSLEIAGKVKEGITSLFDNADEVHLAAHNTFGGAGGGNQLRAGYLAVVRATDDELVRDELSIQNDKLCRGGKPLTGFDYMLLRFEIAATRDDFQHFSDISALRAEAIAAYLGGDEPKGDALRASLMAKIVTHPDLINADRRALAKLVREELDELKGGGNAAAPSQVPAWSALVASIRPTQDHSKVTLTEVLPPP